jgi:nitroreductase
MEFIDVLNARHSARAFTREPIPEDRLQRVLERAAAAPSWSNTQPYQIALAQGADLAALGDELSERFERLAPLQRAPAWKKALAAVRRSPALPDGDFRPVISTRTTCSRAAWPPARACTGISASAVTTNRPGTNRWPPISVSSARPPRCSCSCIRGWGYTACSTPAFFCKR